MMKRLLSLFVLLLTFGALSASAADKANIVYLDLKYGRVTIELRPDLAPKHVERFKKLTKEGFYNGLKFHRVISGFMAQTGDPTGTGTGGSKYPDLPAEFTTSVQFKRGTLGAARTSDPNSANSQFFICFDQSPNLDGQYTIFGQVTDGMQFVDRIRRGEGESGEVMAPDTIVKMQLATDAK
jgi:peptidylprolyl isomerase